MRIGTFFLLLAFLCFAAGGAVWIVGKPPFAMAFAWPALAFLAVSLAYFKVGARLMGKRPDGSLPILIVVLLLPYFLLTWGIWWLVRLGRERCHDLVAPGIYIGRKPVGSELPKEVTLVVDLTAELPRPPGIRTGCEYLCLPTLDGLVPAEAPCRHVIELLAVHPGPVYVHCAQGHGRSALVVGALLVRKGLAASAADAEAMMKAARPGVSLSRSQRALLGKLV